MAGSGPAKTRDAPEWSWSAGWKVGARPQNKNLEFPCFAQENAESANICIHRPLKSLNNFYPPPNFQKIFFGGFWEYQRVASKKVCKLRIFRKPCSVLWS